MKDITEYVLYELQKQNGPEPKAVVLGDLNYDYIFNCPALQPGKEVMISTFFRNIAGAGGYFSCGLARLGADVALLTDVGEDHDGKSLVKEIQEAGVNVQGIRVLRDKKTPFSMIFTPEKEKKPRQVATYPGTLDEFSVRNTDYRYIREAELVYSCNYFILRRLRREIPEVFRLARTRNILTAYDANAGDGWEEPDQLKLLKNKIYPATDIIFLNQHESCCLTGTAHPDEALRVISPNSTTVVIKLGPGGVAIRHRKRTFKLAGFSVGDKLKDTIGAGDSFQAAFIYFYLKRFPIELCGILGQANAASTTMHHGGTTGQCNRKQLAEFIKNFHINDMGDGVISVETGRRRL
ncbi:MAG: carbohydrate kinase family protein [Spirochaetota bacterium]